MLYVHYVLCSVYIIVCKRRQHFTFGAKISPDIYICVSKTPFELGKNNIEGYITPTDNPSCLWRTMRPTSPCLLL